LAADGPSLYPLMHYRDPLAAIDFLERAFGFERMVVVPHPDRDVQHAELAFGTSVFMIGGDDDDPRLESRPGQGWVYVAVDDIDGHCEVARREGAEIITEPFESEHGFRGYTALDPEGNQWHFGNHRPVTPAAPGAPA
jgi:uncharacterized glyoxalase superfamily protein PhnB